MVLDAYSEAQKEKLVDSYGQKLRVDHLLVVRDQDIERMKQLGVVPSVAMWHLMIPIKSLVYANGADEVNNMTKVKSYIDAGLKVVGEMSSACPFWSMENVLVTPHISGASRPNMRRVFELFVENLHRFVHDEPLLNLVNAGRGY